LLVIWKLDRLGRSLKDLIDKVTALQVRQIGLCSLQESIDTTTSGGKLIFHLFGALAEFERDLIRERTQAGLHAARARGHHGGRPTVMDARKVALAQWLYINRQHSPREICATLKISKTTLYRYLSADAKHKG
jgi:DNA invertase Pin-like site-specific DNA recombinase